jgi:alkylation response protein AidB-like acyl-CoA dehydrogenase
MSEELARVGAPQLPSQGVNHIGPILMEFGTEAQQAQHLPPIVEGTVIWAQGYSEPGAGSDLASLATRATLQGDHFVVRGQKIWTTWGHYSDWMFALVRTDPQAQPRHAGISFLLIDLHSPGIRIRPITTIAGDDEFSEVFFDDVVVPAENLIGKLNDGWRIATALLGHERLATSNPQYALIALDRIKTMARASGVMADPAFRDRLAAAGINVTALSALFSHAVELTNQQHSPGPESSIIKIFGSELLQALNELLLEAAGGHAPAEQPVATEFGEVDVATSYLQSRRVTIYGGSSEIQRNVVARRVLNLPSS